MNFVLKRSVPLVELDYCTLVVKEGKYIRIQGANEIVPRVNEDAKQLVFLSPLLTLYLSSLMQ